MNWYSFIFSEQKTQRLQRHLVFWFLWWIYFSASFYHYKQAGLENVAFEQWSFPFFIKSLLLLSIHIIACYWFINYLMPRYLFRKKYAALVMQTVLLGLAILLASYFLHKVVFPFVINPYNHETVTANQNIWWSSITSGLLSAPKVICAAAAIKLMKRWWLKQKETERLEKEKLITELQLLKAQMHPEFLFASLDNICLMTEKRNVQTASMLLLKLADILSYILYECDSRLVSLEKEIKAIKDYLQLQKTRMGNRLELDVAVKGEAGDIMITPLLLFSFIENSFLFISKKRPETSWLNLELQIDNNEITMKLIHGKTAEAFALSENENALAKARKRLDFYYPDHYELKTTIEPEIMMTYLKIVLRETDMKNENSIYTAEQLIYATD